ncbi:MAG TPA: plastocyanin/azurin family copper-binding protein [Actinomycetota bacterium]|nr:plastocyanin/azurin family copper-binding protein [Actinomycetota bacterium]
MRKILIAVVLLLAAASCGGSNERAVTVEHVAFAPATLEIDAGAEVTWTNRDAGVAHTATSGAPGDAGVPGLGGGTPPRPDGLFDGEMDGDGAKFSFTFDEPGRYAYFCRVHQSMTGEIVVR